MARDTGDALLSTTLRLTAHDRALLDKLVELEAEELRERGVDVNLSSAVRQLVRQAAKARGIVVTDEDLVARQARPAPRPPRAAQETVRTLLRKRMAQKRGLGAEIARRFGVEAAQVSRFKAGEEAFPAAKLDELYAFLKGETDE
jgi:transcriptional regulator with XRE-family HTH domain